MVKIIEMDMSRIVFTLLMETPVSEINIYPKQDEYNISKFVKKCK